jgi:hypothetical protein
MNDHFLSNLHPFRARAAQISLQLHVCDTGCATLSHRLRSFFYRRPLA